jgi:ABC-type polysaccharide/polyol phosphate transport system ATPase subunit
MKIGLPKVSDATAPIVVSIAGVSKRFTLRRNQSHSIKESFLALMDASRREFSEDLWALRKVSLTIRAGEAVAFVGRNGSGKSTLLKLVAGITAPTEGDVLVTRGARIGTMIELGIGFHGELSARENVYLNAAIHGLSQEAIDEIYPQVVAYSGLENFMEQPVKNFSSGMHMRLGFAVAVNLKPDVLLLDEVFAVGDADFQQRCLLTMRTFREQGGTLLFVSHSPDAVRQICDRACVLDSGALVFDGPVEQGLSAYAALAASHGEVLPGAGARSTPGATEPWHRMAMGGAWDDVGAWARRFLLAEGLRRDQFLLDVGCGSLPVAQHLLPYMDVSHYWGFDTSRELFNAGVMHELNPRGIDPARGHFIINERFDLSECPYGFDVALAHSFLPRLLPDQVGPLLSAVIGHMPSGGRFYLAVGVPRLDGGHAPMGALVQQLADVIGVRVETRPDAGHPRGDEMMVLVKP